MRWGRETRIHERDNIRDYIELAIAYGNRSLARKF